MYETEIALGLMASASALYGFYLAYYTFARTLQLQDATRAYESSQEGLLSVDDLNKGIWRVNYRNVLVDFFLALASAFFLVSVFSDLVWLAWAVPCSIAVSEISFGALALLVIPLSYFAAKNLKERWAEMRRLAGPPSSRP